MTTSANITLFISTILIIGSWVASFGLAEEDSGLENQMPESTSCLDGLFEGQTDLLKAHFIDIDFTGRLAVGDLNADNQIDFVVSNRHQLAAYDLCGNKLWQVNASTNWDNPDHVYWNWTSFGFIGDADGDDIGEFLHIGADWRSLYIRNGKNGLVEHEIDLGAQTQWMYVILGNRSEEVGHKTTRIFVTGRPGDNSIKAIDIRTGEAVVEWFYSKNRIQNAYMPPIAINLDQRGGDEIVHSTVAVSETGSQIWRHEFSDYSVLGAAHTLTVKDIDISKPGLEAVYSIYGPHRGAPSLVSLASSTPESINWEAYSPHNERHPHQHAVGDFDIDHEGLEILARNNDGKNHWLVDASGNLLHPKVRLDTSILPGDWDSGELVQGIEWNEHPGTEVLYTERHVKFREIPRLIVTSPSEPLHPVTPFFHGGIDIMRTDDDPRLSDKPDPGLNSWFGYVNRPSRYDNDGPYEGSAHTIDLFGDGREEVLTWGANKIIIYYNSGDAGVEKRRSDPVYMNTKKVWTNVYNPR